MNADSAQTMRLGVDSRGQAEYEGFACLYKHSPSISIGPKKKFANLFAQDFRLTFVNLTSAVLFRARNALATRSIVGCTSQESDDVATR